MHEPFLNAGLELAAAAAKRFHFVGSRHDQLFKRLLHAFFPDFLAAFVPAIRRDLDPKSIQFLDKELIQGRRDEHNAKLVDLVARVKFCSGERFVLVHVEHQARREWRIDLRLFLYAVWLIERYKLPVYPILLTSRTGSFRTDSARLRIVDFRYHVVQLNRMNWRDFVPATKPGRDGVSVLPV